MVRPRARLALMTGNVQDRLRRVAAHALVGVAARSEWTAPIRVHWHNTERLHGYLGDVSPTESETNQYAASAALSEPLGLQ